MGDTTVTIPESVKDRLDNYRHDNHYNYGETLESMMEIVPTPEEIEEEGCARCGETPHTEGPIDNQYGVVHWFQYDHEGLSGVEAIYYCSRECLAEQNEEVERQFPRDPDKLVIGGKDQERIEIESNIEFILDGSHREVSINIPGAFSNVDYEYEPVYLENQGEWIQSGIVDDMLNSAKFTGITLGSSIGVEQVHHPSDRVREENTWDYTHCPECDKPLSFDPDIDAFKNPDECPGCGEEVDLLDES